MVVTSTQVFYSLGVSDGLMMFYLSCNNFQLLQSLGKIKGSYSEICQESKAKVSKRQTSDTGNMYSYIIFITVIHLNPYQAITLGEIRCGLLIGVGVLYG